MVYKEFSKIYYVDPAEGSEVILAKLYQGFWHCCLCEEKDAHRGRMMQHTRYTHILVG